MKKTLAVLLLHLLAAFVHSQVVSLPGEIKGAPGAWIVVAPLIKEGDGGVPKWRVDPHLQEVDLSVLLGEFASKLKGRVFTCQQPGSYKIEVWNAKGDVPSDIATTFVVIGTPLPPIPPVPPVPPVPPGPTPSPSPFPDAGLRVFILWDDKGAKLPEDQQDIIFNPDVRQYLEAKCPVGPDGKTREYRMWPLKDGKVDGTPPKIWADALARPKRGSTLPWLIIGNGKDGYEGPLPKNKDEAMTLLKQFGG